MMRILALIMTIPCVALGEWKSVSITAADTAEVDLPYVCDDDSTVYTLEVDFNADDNAFYINFNGDMHSTLDLNGHNVRFGMDSDPDNGNGVIAYRGSWGVEINRTANHVRITGGTLTQGAAEDNDAAGVYCYGESGTAGAYSVQIDSMTFNLNADYDCKGAIYLAYGGDYDIYDNTINNNAKMVLNRMTPGSASIDFVGAVSDGYFKVYGNTINGGPQWGIRIARASGSPTSADSVLIYNNEIYHSAVVTNGYGIGIHGPPNGTSSALCRITNNTINPNPNGRGIHIEGAQDVLINYNNIDVINMGNSEYAVMNSHGIKLDMDSGIAPWDNIEIANNTVVSHGQYDERQEWVHPVTAATTSNVRSIGMALDVDTHYSETVPNPTANIHDNYFRAMWDGHIDAAGDTVTGAVGITYLSVPVNFYDTGNNGNITISDNTFVSNSALIYFSYDCGGDLGGLVFDSDEWVLWPPVSGHGNGGLVWRGTAGGDMSDLHFRDATYTNSADLTATTIVSGAADFNYEVEWTTTVQAGVSGASVWVVDQHSTTVESGTADESGDCVLYIPQYTLDYDGSSVTETSHNNYTVYAASDGDTLSTVVTINSSGPIALDLSSNVSLDSATVSSGVLAISWTDDSSTEWQVQATINGTTSYTILVDSASASFPVAAGTIDIKVTGDASGFTQGQASN
jgi:hypothetical protein